MEQKIDYVVSLLKSLSNNKNNEQILKIEEEIVAETKLIIESLQTQDNLADNLSLKKKINELGDVLSELTSKHKSQNQVLLDFNKFLRDRKINTS